MKKNPEEIAKKYLQEEQGSDVPPEKQEQTNTESPVGAEVDALVEAAQGLLGAAERLAGLINRKQNSKAVILALQATRKSIEKNHGYIAYMVEQAEFE